MGNDDRFARRLLWTAAASIAVTACGTSSDTSDASAEAGPDVATSDAIADTGPDAGDAANDASDAAVCSSATFATTKVAFGDGNNGQWKSLGFNIDGLASTAASTDVCLPNSGGNAATAYPDGNNGIDNSWGKNIMPLIIALSPTWPTDVNNDIQSGMGTTLYELSCLPPTGDAPSFLTKLFVATPLGTTPLLDGTDHWPVAPEYLSNSQDPESSTITFASSSITTSLFDSQANKTFAVRFPLGATSINMMLHAAHVQMTLSTDRKSASAGMIGGVIKTEDLVAEVKKVGYALNLCAQLATIITAIRQASDILSDGTQDPNKTCDGISIGLGFEATQAQRGPVGPVAQVAQSCP